MALGGGPFLTQNKVLPGTYHNFISAARAFVNLSDRGYVALPIAHDYGVDGTVLTLTAEDLQKNSQELLGYDYTHEKLKPFREVFRKAHTAFVYFLKGSSAAPASNDYATANFKGLRGNDLKVVIQTNVDDSAKFDVSLYLGANLVDEQKAVVAADLVANAYVTYKNDATLTVTAGVPLTGGSDGTVTPVQHQNALDEFEAYGFNALVCDSTDSGIIGLYEAYTKRLRDEVGAKFQLIVHNLANPDHEGLIVVHNKAVEGEAKLVYWTAGSAAGCAVNASNTNMAYDGEYTVNFDGAKTQLQLTNLLKAGKFVFHRVGEETRVLEDINSFVSFSPDKNEDFSMNQVIRVLDQIAIDTAHLFNTRYLGKVPNDQDGRISLWNDLGSHRLEMQRIRAIQNYNKDVLKVEQGNSKKAVVVNEVVEPTVAMSQLYITTTVA
ncbi:MAG: phage tail sheath subtilisin-like domain-containing protein [Psychrobacillus sp.]